MFPIGRKSTIVVYDCLKTSDYTTVYSALDGNKKDAGSYCRTHKNEKIKNITEGRIPVSYTHLTLPTICSV